MCHFQNQKSYRVVQVKLYLKRILEDIPNKLLAKKLERYLNKEQVNFRQMVADFPISYLSNRDVNSMSIQTQRSGSDGRFSL